jgi:hypothetical protein
VHTVGITTDDGAHVDAVAAPKSVAIRYGDASRAADTRPKLGRRELALRLFLTIYM